ncbi:MAG: hypothetical protein LIR46_00600 [Bacteroidota bacterium]|nr:hypothetical protein [Bacteroidota bacterium]
MLRPMTVEEANMVKEECYCKRSKLEAMLDEFVAMDVPCVEVTNHQYATGWSGVSSIRAAIKRYHYDSIECMTMDDKIYLFNNSVK